MVDYVSEKQLSKNQQDHNKAARVLSNYKGNHKFVNLAGKEHSIALEQLHLMAMERRGLITILSPANSMQLSLSVLLLGSHYMYGTIKSLASIVSKN